MNPMVLDASLWVARLVPQDVFHEIVKSWMAEQLASGITFLAPSLLLAEVAGAISRRTDCPELGLRGADSAYVAVAAQLDLPLVTLDIDQGRRAAQAIAILEIPVED